jgi:hypothetical protein
MEKDINTIVDVDEGEALLLLELIETLFRDWYVARHQQTTTLAAIKAIADKKQRERIGQQEPPLSADLPALE